MKYDVVVVGAGHAGCEAAVVAAKMKSKVLLITMSLQNIAQMSCNPAIGGIAKGQIVREIDALGGLTAVVTDRSAVQFKMLNTSKGPAMWSPRSQNDRHLFSQLWRTELENNPNIDFYQDTVNHISLDVNGAVSSVKTSLGVSFDTKTVVLTNGTFLNGLIHVGEKTYAGGRHGEKSVRGITACLLDLGFRTGRMKTGTPPRVDGRSIDYSKMSIQKGDANPRKFSYSQNTNPVKDQMPCFLTHTNSLTHEYLKEGFDRSPMFNGTIKSIGPRYCPSIEDKINRFADKTSHQIFIEPEGRHTVEMYVNGFSTSLPQDIQEKALKTVLGLEQVKFFRPGYAIEYDYFPPTQLKATLETKLVKNLFFAGQINGTTGYEEAASQGLIAGINAASNVRGLPPFILNRDQAYIGVLIDDLITKGTDEPYRMFTSRAEFRLLLRQDNADIRLSEKANALGVLDESYIQDIQVKKATVDKVIKFFKTQSVSHLDIQAIMKDKTKVFPTQSDKAYRFLLRPEITLKEMLKIPTIAHYFKAHNVSEELLEIIQTEIKYEGYIDKEQRMADKMKSLQKLKIPEKMDYSRIKALSTEARQKLESIQPTNLFQASQISGVSPSDINVLMVKFGR